MSNIQLIEIKHDGATESIHCEKLSDNIYKCLESCISNDFIRLGCEIEVEKVDGKINFLWLFKESPFTTFTYFLSKETIESNGLKKMKDDIIRWVVNWKVQWAECLLFICQKTK